jgi:hypothetical protein
MAHISRRSVLGATCSAAVAGVATTGASALFSSPAHAAPDGTWTLENDVLRVVVGFTTGSLAITSVFNKAAGQEYQTVASGRRLFWYTFDGNRTVAADDGGWVLGTPTTSPIVMNSRDGQRSIGQQLRMPITRTSPLPMTVTAVFELYGGRGGLRFSTLIRNNDTSRQATIQNSVVFAVGAAQRTHTIHFVSAARWLSTTAGLAPTPADTSSASKRAEMPKKALNVYSDGHGWSLSPELNWKTQRGNGNYSDYMRPPFAVLNLWSGIAHVQLQTNPQSLQLVLFPGEEFEYLAVNLTVFTGGAVEGKMATRSISANGSGST